MLRKPPQSARLCPLPHRIRRQQVDQVNVRHAPQLGEFGSLDVSHPRRGDSTVLDVFREAEAVGSQAAAVVTVVLFWVMEISQASLAFGAPLGTSTRRDNTPTKAIIPG